MKRIEIIDGVDFKNRKIMTLRARTNHFINVILINVNYSVCSFPERKVKGDFYWHDISYTSIGLKGLGDIISMA